MRRASPLALALALAACKTAAPVPPAPPVAPPATAAVPEPKIALVLGGGAARGFAHVGVIRVLEQERIPVDLVVGTSVGSLIGALFAAVATDLNWGTRIILDKGSVARAVRASSAIPGVFEPVTHDGKLLVDGGVVDNIPIDVARAKGADLVVAVDISEDVGNVNIKNLVDVLLQSTNIMFAVNVANLRGAADVLVTPKVGGIGMLDFGQRKQAMEAGIVAAREAVPKIREAVQKWKAKKAAEAVPRG
jgi:predicted acylesterase/phospholipase RssA